MTSGSASPTSRSRPDQRPARPHLHRRRRGRARGALRLPRRRRRLAQHLPPGSSPRRCAASSSGSTPSPGSASCARRPTSAPELIYNHSDRGFALISQRTETLQRMYFQCDPGEDVDDWSDDRIWEELQARVGANGHTLQEGPITSRTVLPFRSFVCRSRCVTATCCWPATPRTPCPRPAPRGSTSPSPTSGCSPRSWSGPSRKNDGAAARRLRGARARPGLEGPALLLLDDHDAAPAPRGASAFDVRRQEGELASLVASRAGSTYLAEGYTGWPQR